MRDNSNLNRISRREMLRGAGAGCGALALTALLGGTEMRAALPDEALNTGPKVKAKSVIWLFMNGGPSGIDLFDYKPMLDKMHGQPFPEPIKTLFPYPGPIMKPIFKFKRHGESGVHVAEPYSNIAKHVDDITFLKACHSTELNHSPARYLINSGTNQMGGASFGSWLNYGLGSANENLPGFVVMFDSADAPEGGSNLWGNGFLPASTQAVPFHTIEEPVLYLKRPHGLSDQAQRTQLELLDRLNQHQQSIHAIDAKTADQLESRIKSFETAYRMQMSVPEVVDISKETLATQEMYGVGGEGTHHFGSRLLMARRLVERGVRCVQIYSGGPSSNWDDHDDIKSGHLALCRQTDVPVAGLIQDLKQRGMLDETLVIWGGEFGRLPISQDVTGRDHNPYGFTMFMAGGGLKRGYSHGELDEFGYKPVSGAVSMHDLHATLLHLMGIDHEKLSFFFNGRDQSLTNALGNVIHDVIA